MELREELVIENLNNLLQVKTYELNILSDKLDFAKRSKYGELTKAISKKYGLKKREIMAILETAVCCGYDSDISFAGNKAIITGIKPSSNHDLLAHHNYLEREAEVL